MSFYKEELKRLKSKAESIELDNFNKRHLDNAFHAITLKELDHVIENTTSIAVQDYALLKKSFFYEIKGIKE